MLQPHYKPLVLFIFSLLLINIENLELIKTRKNIILRMGQIKALLLMIEVRKKRKNLRSHVHFFAKTQPTYECAKLDEVHYYFNQHVPT